MLEDGAKDQPSQPLDDGHASGTATLDNNVSAPGEPGSVAAVGSPGNQAELAGASDRGFAPVAQSPSHPPPPPPHDTAVLIVGMAARGPGFETASQFFSALLEKRDLAAQPMAGKDRFDHSFFQKSLHEARYTDPQIRFLLELTYEALVDAGVSDLCKLPRPDIGVYVGSSFADFHSNTLAQGPADGYEHIGAAGTMLANTISRFFQFGGVSMKIDSACSSSLQALDVACHDIRSGKCKMALVAGSNVILDEQITRAYEKSGLVSTRQDAACRAFCKDADGYVRQEAVVVIILSQRAEAEAHGLTRYAEVVGHKSVTGSGKSVTSPSAEAQGRLYSSTAAMAAPRLPASAAVRFVECHGTGTLKGDAVETSALSEALDAAPNASTVFSRAQLPLAIGSVKSNVGHTESASGLLGLLKAILSLENGCVPPNLHYTDARRNPNCTGLGGGSLRVVTGKAEPLEHDAVVAVNSFGFGGTYVQVLLRGVPQPLPAEGHAALAADNQEPWKNINPLMGRDSEAVMNIAKAVQEQRFQGTVTLPHCTGPATFGARAFTTPIAKDIFVQAEALQTTAATMQRRHPPVWVVFSGNGGVWLQMGSELYAHSACYRQLFSQFDEYLQSKWDCETLKQLKIAQGSAATAAESRPAAFENIVDATVSLVALQVCLIELLKMVGFTRDVCDGFVGHSAGEIAAGYFDQCYGWRTALDIAYVRGQVAAEMAARTPGAMCAVQGLTREAVQRELAHIDSLSVCVACHTGHLQVTLSGTVAGVNAAKALLASKHPDIRLTDLNTFGAAFHSSMIQDSDVAALNVQLGAIFEGCPPDQCKRSQKWISTCFERDDPRGARVDSAYHCRGFKDCVEFYRAVKTVPSNAVIVECGPRGSLRSVFKGNAFYALLSSQENAVDSLASVYGHLFLHEIPLSGAIEARALPRDIFPAPSHRHVRERFIAWDHSRRFDKYLDTSRGPAAMAAGASHMQPLILDLKGEQCWLRDHKVAGLCLLPAAVYLAAIRQVCMSTFPGATAHTIHDFEIHAPVDTHSCTTLQLDMDFCQLSAVNGPVDGGTTETRHDVTVHANGKKVATCSVHCIAKAGAARRPSPPPERSSTEGRVPVVGDDSPLHGDSAAAYNKLGRHGYEYTGCFRVLADVPASGDTAQVQVDHTDWSSSHADLISCALMLEGMLQLSILNHLGSSQYGKCLLPVRIKSVRLEAGLSGTKAASARVVKNHQQQHQRGVLGGCSLTAHDREVAALTGLELTPGPSSGVLADVETRELRLKRLLCCSYDAPPEVSFSGEGQRVFVGDAEEGGWHLSFLPCEDDPGECAEQPPAACNVKFKAWQEKILSLRSSGAGAPPVLLMSRAAGFPGFVRSLQKEPGFGHVRGLAMLSALQARPPKELLRYVLGYFEQNTTQSCLFVRDADGHKIEVLVERTQPIEGVSDVRGFNAPNGCFLASSPGPPDFTLWKPLTRVSSPPHDDEGIWTVRVKFASINFRDVMIVQGKLPRSRALTGYGQHSSGLGLDFAGFADCPADRQEPRHGDQPVRVIGLGRDCISTTLSRQPEYLCWTLEESQDLEAFATVPCAYATAYYALCIRGRLHKDHKVLVHCGAGGVGLAALRLCQFRLKDVQSQLFVTCGSEHKREYLHHQYGIPKENIGDSRSCSFRELVAKRTDGAGVDLVLNSLAGEKLEASIACLSFGGLLLELGKAEIGSTVPDCLRRDDRQLVMIDLDQIMARKDKFQAVRDLLEQGLRSGEVVPLRCRVFCAPHETKAAFDYMSHKDRIGKVVLKIDQERPSVIGAPLETLVDTTATRPATQQYLIVILGGFGGLGQCLSQLFAERFGCGCQLVLCTREEGGNDRLREERQRRVEGLRNRYNIDVDIFTGDLSRPAEVHRLMVSLRQRGPGASLWGIFHAAARTHDVSFERMSESNWSTPMAAKIGVLQTLGQCLDDEQYADLAATLRLFVCFSSVVAGDGNAGQANYAFANSCMERFMMERAHHSKPAVCIRLGLVKHTGLATTVKSQADLQHLWPLSAEGALDAVERILALQRPGLYTVYGKKPAHVNSIKPQAQQVILDALKDHSPGSPDLGKVPLHTHMNIILNDSLAFLGLKEQLRLLGFDVAVFDEDLSSLALSEFIARLTSSSSLASSAEARGSGAPSHADVADVVVIVPLGPTSVSRLGGLKLTGAAHAALLSVQAQTHCPHDIIVVLEEDYAQEDAARLELEIQSVLPRARVTGSTRSRCPRFGHGSRFGSLNAGILASLDKVVASSSHTACWVATIDPAADEWAPEHLELCVCAAAVAPSCQMVIATNGNTPSSPNVFGGSLEGIPAFSDRGRLLVRRTLLLEAGMFDEAFKDEPGGGLADLDLFIRTADIIAAQTLAAEERAWCAASGEQTVRSIAIGSAKAPATALNGETERSDNLPLFLYKHHTRMTKAHAEQLRTFGGGVGTATEKRGLATNTPECRPTPLRMWNGDDIQLRHDTFDVFAENQPTSLNPQDAVKTLVGVITSNAARVRGLLSDLGGALDDPKHGVVVFVNAQDTELAADMRQQLKVHAFRGHVILSTDPIVLKLRSEWYGPNAADPFPLPIAQSRTVLQTFLAAATEVEQFDAVAVLDDDMRLPRTWGVRPEAQQDGDIFLSRAIRTPPNPTALSMRTQLLDFLYALDRMHSHPQAPSSPTSENAWHCPSFEIYHRNLQDQYYDLSSTRWDHLEVPRRFDSLGSDDFVERCRQKIFVGDPLAREAVSVEEGESMQRGSCMVLLRDNFSLLRTAHAAPFVELASGRRAASRRSDTFWVQRHCRDGKRPVVVRHLSALHDNTHDSIPSPEQMREVVALEMIGAVLCRPTGERVAFEQHRTAALRCSTARIRGICKTLRSRPYFQAVQGLVSFVEELEAMFSEDLWDKDVYSVVGRNLNRLCDWEVHRQADQLTARNYRLGEQERMFLGQGRDQSCGPSAPYPRASDLRCDGPHIPIPCLHRIHDDNQLLQGAHRVQERIGMSLPRSQVKTSLRYIAQLQATCKPLRSQGYNKALVTMDDGFRDVLLLRDIFSELRAFLQPVLFVPSGLLRGEADKRRHLPLTCLYSHCDAKGIDVEDRGRLGHATRSELKRLSEQEQYWRLEEAGIAIDLATDDLLTPADLCELDEAGWWIATHGPDHSDLTRVANIAQIAERIRQDVEHIARNNWTPWFAWPEGQWCACVAGAVAQHVGGLSAQFGLSKAPDGETDHPAVIRRTPWIGGERRLRVLVTGGHGFLGKHLCLLLQSYGYEVFRFDIEDNQDILDQKAFTDELREKRIKACVHLAAVSDLNEAEAGPERATQVNVEGTRAVLAGCDACGVRLLFASTCCVYGNNGAELNDEAARLAPTELYAETKVEGERLVLASAKLLGLRHVVMRLATFYGPGMREALATARFLRAAITGTPIRIHGTGEQTRCYTHVHDVAEGIRVILQESNFSGVVNVSDDRECSVSQLAQAAMSAAGSYVEVVHEADRVGQIRRSCVDNARLRALGNRSWRPTISLEQGLAQCATLMRSDLLSGKGRDAIATVSFSKPIGFTPISLKLPTLRAPASQAWVSKNLPDGTQLVALAAGDLTRASVVAVRIHSECLFGDVLGSLKCDCGPQKDDFLSAIGDDRPGVFVYIKGHEGRGAGLEIKARAYADLDRNPRKHHNEALVQAGAPREDMRTFTMAASFLLELLERHKAPSGAASTTPADAEQAVVEILLYTNNPAKVEAMAGAASQRQAARCRFVCHQQAIPAKGHCNPFNEKYLKEKEQDNGHVGLCVPSLPFKEQGVPELPKNIDQLPSTTPKINSHVFEACDSGLFDFLKEHGFVVVRSVVTSQQVKEATQEHERILRQQFGEVQAEVGDELEYEEFAPGVSQVRDLFLWNDGDNIFKRLTCEKGPTSLSRMAQRAMAIVDPEGQWDGIRLLHDHIIKKPPAQASKKIPLHQDSMFWPVDVPGCSTWTILSEAPLDGGCIEILDLKTKPHLHRQNTAPVDFMADELGSGLRLVLENDGQPVRWFVPMRAGETLIFPSNTWHRSSPNMREDLDRIAYIQTWTHPRARWRPDLVPWHPVNEHLEGELNPNDLLTGKRHPLVDYSDYAGTAGEEFRSRSVYLRQPLERALTATKQSAISISMFDASDVVQTQIRNILAICLEEPNAGALSLVDILKDSLQFRARIVQATLDAGLAADPNSLLAKESGCDTAFDQLLWVLKKLMISVACYKCHRSRNVFNSVYGAWWTLAGEAWNRKFLDGRFDSRYRLCKGDVGRFLKRIRVDVGDHDTGSDTGQLALLEAVVAGFFEHIPFQNFTMLTRAQRPNGSSGWQRRPPTLGEIVSDMLEGYGGLCSSRNPFLLLLLKAMGFSDVAFVSGTMCSPLLGKTRENMHIALLVRVGDLQYWVDVANGFPYVRPVALPLRDGSTSAVIQHPFCSTQLARRDGRIMVRHRFNQSLGNKMWPSEVWIENYHFAPEHVEYAVFRTMLDRHYSLGANTGPFLKNLRFNLWTTGGGVTLLGDGSDVWEGHGRSPSPFLQAPDSVFQFEAWINKHGFQVEPRLARLLPEAWVQCRLGRGDIEAAEDITVTGGFFDGSANAYLGGLTVWRAATPDRSVVALTIRIHREYVPEEMPVVNKGFAGGCWLDGRLYVCWPNRVAMVEPASEWSIQQHIDNPQFNDLHHVHADADGLWVANTGMDCIDHMDFAGGLVSRTSLVGESRGKGGDDDSLEDIRDQRAHDARRGCDKEHVNFVSVEDASDGAGPRLAATLLQSKRVVHIQEGAATPPDSAVQLMRTSPPHEGFVCCTPSLREAPLRWNSTVNGLVLASEPHTGEIFRRWDLSHYVGHPRGWTRGLCVLKDGFLVGSTVIRGTAAEWLNRHENTWNFDTGASRTAVIYVPFTAMQDGEGVVSVDVMTERAAKIFSLLLTP
jgi:acyl transferase domain-containing protein/nucleoside-diphosphate-sugar epimerase/NADPH:quinone reductase-like Zn-dependent oxidoreductase/GTP cyclohydrolase II/arylamine N-acetyltransferase/ectoine hydroxylase-related dioxygenase (phytanoyl-CoA dioxygenase family)